MPTLSGVTIVAFEEDFRGLIDIDFDADPMRHFITSIRDDGGNWGVDVEMDQIARLMPDGYEDAMMTPSHYVTDKDLRKFIVAFMIHVTLSNWRSSQASVSIGSILSNAADPRLQQRMEEQVHHQEISPMLTIHPVTGVTLKRDMLEEAYLYIT